MRDAPAHLVSVTFGPCQIPQVVFSASGRNLPSFYIHRIIFLIDQIRHLHEFISLSFQCRDECIQRLGSVLRSIVAKDDRAVAQMLVVTDGIDDGVHAIVLPV